MKAIKVSNTLTGKKESLETIEPGHVKMYACGVTTYDDCHIGHAMQAIYFDMIRSYLRFAGYKVTYVRNYTDVDDKVIAKAKQTQEAPLDLAERIIKNEEKDMQALGIEAPDFSPRVSRCIPEIIEMIDTLVKEGAAYVTSTGDVYYRVKAKNDYGKLSNRNPEELRSGTRDLVLGEKEDELDFALWKHEQSEGAFWQSPWGSGRPGWHIECSAMSKKHLGKSFDIHGGGRDLVFPHHENEIAQSESANHCNYATYWLHSGLLTINKQKMSKSLGNHILISSFLEKYPGEVLRLAYLQNHYSSNVDFTEDVFSTCLRRLLYFYESLLALDELAEKANDQDYHGPWVEGHDPSAMIEAFHKEMSNDFSTVTAIRDLHLCFRKANELIRSKKSQAKFQTAKAYAGNFRLLFGVLGLLKQEPKSFMDGLKKRILPELNLTEDDIQSLIAARQQSKVERDFEKADNIRDELLAKGIELRDTPHGTTWSIVFK